MKLNDNAKGFLFCLGLLVVFGAAGTADYREYLRIREADAACTQEEAVPADTVQSCFGLLRQIREQETKAARPGQDPVRGTREAAQD